MKARLDQTLVIKMKTRLNQTLENLKLPTEDQVILEEPASSFGTLSSLQNLEKDLSFTDQFFIEKPQEEELGKTNAEAEVQSMVSVPIHQDTSSVPPMTTPVIDLTNQAVGEIVTDAVDWAMQAPLRARFRHLPTVDMKEILQQRMFEDNSYKAHDVHNDLYEAVQKSLELDYSNQRLADQEEARKKRRKRRTSGASGSSQLPPPPPPPSTGTSGSAQQQGSNAPSSSKTAALASQSMAWTTSDTRYESAGVSRAQESSPTDSLMHKDSIPDDQVHFSDDEDSGNDHLPKADSQKDWWKPLPKEERPATLEPAWIIPSSNVSDVDWTNPERDQVRFDVKRPLPLSGLPGHETIQTHFFFNKDLEYLRYGSKGSSPALSISKMKAARHDSPSRRKEVRTHMRILNVVRIKAYSRYGYDYLSEIVLRKADFQEHTIAEKDFKNLYPNDFKDLNLLLLQDHLDHLPGSNKWLLSTAVKLWT
ncbi:hypothetical protein Tco_0908711 [Tanacetum coccineum]|uniref:Uncharacterized protein n=1 Tax=Tanacetum coccineum TaxID=301880 RepID=A0ABQ5CMY7_9ASTR